MIPPGDATVFEPEASTIIVPPDPVTELAARAGSARQRGTAAPRSKEDEITSSFFGYLVRFMVPQLSKPERAILRNLGKAHSVLLPEQFRVNMRFRHVLMDCNR